MGRFKHLVDSLASMEGFRVKYHIPQGVVLEYCPSGILTNREEGEVVIPMIAFIEGGMPFPMGRNDTSHVLRTCIFGYFNWTGCHNCKFN